MGRKKELRGKDFRDRRAYRPPFAISTREDAMTAMLLATALVAPFPVINPAQLAWKPKDALPPGAHGALVRGDPHTGPYAFFGRFPARFTVPMHWHTNDVAVV
jgi:hypothetical protein